MLNLNDNDLLNLNRENIIQSLDGLQNSINKNLGYYLVNQGEENTINFCIIFQKNRFIRTL